MLLPKLTRRSALLAAAATLAPTLPALAQSFPSRPIKILVAFNAGGTADLVARLYGQKMSEVLGTPIIIDNRPGANQINAIKSLMSAAPDGYTLYAATGSALVQNPALRTGLPYDPLKDFTLLGLAVTNPGVIFVNNDLPVHNLKELVVYANAKPGKLNYGSGGVGSAGHLGVEALMSATGLKLSHIPYKGDGEVIQAVIAGTVHVGMLTTLSTVPVIKSGKMRAIAVTTQTGLLYLPGVQGLSETAFPNLAGMDPHTFIGLAGPAGLSSTVAAQISDAINKVSAMPDVIARVRETLFAEPGSGTPASFRAFVEKQLVIWRDIGKTVKLAD